MDRLKKHEDELDFFALELQSRRVEQGPWRGWPIALYGVLSDYGRSYARPLYALFAVAAVGKDFFEPAMIAHLPAGLEVVAAIQTILFGTILLFLFGLGVRNRFRMK
jgi:hypothetical protein